MTTDAPLKGGDIVAFDGKRYRVRGDAYATRHRVPVFARLQLRWWTRYGGWSHTHRVFYDVPVARVQRVAPRAVEREWERGPFG